MTIDINIIHSIGKIAVTILVLLAFFLLTVKSHIRHANRFFAAFLLLVAFDLCGLFIYEWLNTHPYIDLIRRTCSLLQMPLFYFYVKAICYRDFQFKFTSLKHSFAFVLTWLLILPRFIFLEGSAQSQFLQDPQHIELIVKHLIGEIQYFIYIFLIFKTLANYKKLYQENYANYDQTAYHWLFQMTLISVCAHLFGMTKDAMTLLADPNWVLIAHLVVSLNVLAIICWLVLKALYHPSITRGFESDQKSITQTLPATTNQQLPTEIHTQIDQLKSFMQDKEPYLDPELSIESLAQMHAIPSKALSTLINHHLGQNFFIFINSYRIQKAQQLLKDPKNAHQTVLEILYQVGFNSKSSFNTAFKKYTGKTPTAYRQQAFE